MTYMMAIYLKIIEDDLIIMTRDMVTCTKNKDMTRWKLKILEKNIEHLKKKTLVIIKTSTVIYFMILPLNHYIKKIINVYTLGFFLLSIIHH